MWRRGLNEELVLPFTLSLFICTHREPTFVRSSPLDAVITVQSIADTSVTLDIPINFKWWSLVHMCGNWCHILIRLALHHLKLIIAQITSVIYKLTVPQHQEINQLWTAVSGLSSSVRTVAGRTSDLLGGCDDTIKARKQNGAGFPGPLFCPTTKHASGLMLPIKQVLV